MSASHTLLEIGREPEVSIGDIATLWDWQDGSRPATTIRMAWPSRLFVLPSSHERYADSSLPICTDDDWLGPAAIVAPVPTSCGSMRT